jgi:hypothetical protein
MLRTFTKLGKLEIRNKSYNSTKKQLDTYAYTRAHIDTLIKDERITAHEGESMQGKGLRHRTGDEADRANGGVTCLSRFRNQPSQTQKGGV